MDDETQSAGNTSVSPSTHLRRGRWHLVLLIITLVLAGYSLLMGALSHWDYLPDWVPVQGPNVGYPNTVSCCLPLIQCTCFIPNFFALAFALVLNLGVLLQQALSGQISRGIGAGVGLIVLVLAGVFLSLGESIDNALLKYAIDRYNVVVDAIQEYHSDQGQYPPQLDALVPYYLPSTPGLYMKFGEVLIYEPGPSAWYDHAPFALELYGHYAGIHGQTLKYCPVAIDPCFEGGGHLTPIRIDDRWIWVYSSAL